jgi:hypothetical protein
MSGVACWTNQQKAFSIVENNVRNSTIGNSAMAMVKIFKCPIIKLRINLKTYVNIMRILIRVQHYNINL